MVTQGMFIANHFTPKQIILPVFRPATIEQFLEEEDHMNLLNIAEDGFAAEVFVANIIALKIISKLR
jgi:hypothetical protein